MEHQAIAEKALSLTADELILIGENFEKCSVPTAKLFRNTDLALEYLKGNPVKDATVLIKGSRGMSLEKLVDFL
jgi:UDP-N-acetylmuramoyl-tripeptide--D-alanyl-D-alanine ligase